MFTPSQMPLSSFMKLIVVIIEYRSHCNHSYLNTVYIRHGKTIQQINKSLKNNKYFIEGLLFTLYPYVSPKAVV